MSNDLPQAPIPQPSPAHWTPAPPHTPAGRGYYPPPPGGYTTPPPISRRWITVTIVGILLALGLLVVAGIHFYRVFQSAGQEQIVPLHEQMKHMDLAGIYADADPAYQQKVSRADSDGMFRSVHNVMGDPVSYSVANVAVNTSTGDGTIKTLVLTTHFALGEGTETMRFRETDGQWHLLYYGCTSPRFSSKKPATSTSPAPPKPTQ